MYLRGRCLKIKVIKISDLSTQYSTKETANVKYYLMIPWLKLSYHWLYLDTGEAVL